MDNQIQDYQNIGTEVQSQEVILQKTYSLLAWSFLPCAAGAFAGLMFNPLASIGNKWIVLGLFFAFFYGMNFMIEKNRYNNTGVTLLMVFTFGMGIMLSPLLGYALGGHSNGASLVGIAALMTAGIFFTMAQLARSSKINSNALGKFLMTGGIILMIGVVANIFLQLPVLSLTISGVFVFFSSLMIMWQVRVILEGGEDSHISAALSIFISVYNLFSSLLHLLLAFAGNDD
ncbi:Bax inhibitor-1 family protein [Alysiella crassa]|uniref:Modulator of FtsH protease YccA n=1 Tax=Alysiella crassa TaxID=153491 RepID=A0A376BLZ3_9NEIS|nr:Bax inhibitor-1 family protein [Alysiella crassa]UOP07073.1 Bax inhibitor-1 family protein [Alysiella crassa]SSY70787.1 Modulator of FtsH protease YccA [Alysiella crassa]